MNQANSYADLVEWVCIKIGSKIFDHIKIILFIML